MKFRDIPQLTPSGSYQTNMNLRFVERWITDNEKDLGLELNPDFQRGHVWTEAQQTAYIEFLLRGGRSSRVIYFNYPGWMTDFKAHRGYNAFVCVDGLQRLTAVRRFMNNETRAFGLFLHEYEDKIPLDIDLLFNVNNLQTRAGVLQWYLELNSGGTPHTDAEILRVQGLLKQAVKEEKG